MADKEEIGKVFKDRLDALQTAPSDGVWTNITDALDKRKKKKRGMIIPLWGKLAGVAAGLSLLLFLGSIYFDDSFGNDTDIDIVDVTKDTIPKVDSERVTKAKAQELRQDNQQILRAEEVVQEPENLPKKEREIVVEKAVNNKRDLPKKALKEANRVPTSSEVASEIDQQKAPSSNNLLKTELEILKIDTTSSVASEMSKNFQNKTNNKIIVKQPDSVFLGKKDTRVTDSEQKNDANEILIEKNILLPKDSVETVIAEGHKKIDILEVLSEKNKGVDTTITENKNRSRWAVTTQLAPVFYGSFEDGSSLDPAFSSNTRTSEANVSYGVKIAYTVTDRLQLRSGFGKTNVSYTTENVRIQDATDALGFLDFDGFDVLGSGSGDGLGIPQEIDPNAPAIELTQEIGYFEIPLEVSFAIVDSKLGVHLVGGVSAFILESQVINRTQNDITTPFGSSNNLNKLTMSGTFGLGAHYDFSKAFQFNLEPVLKVPFNSYTNNSSTFRPYIFGIYTGLSYKF